MESGFLTDGYVDLHSICLFSTNNRQVISLCRLAMMPPSARGRKPSVDTGLSMRRSRLPVIVKYWRFYNGFENWVDLLEFRHALHWRGFLQRSFVYGALSFPPGVEITLHYRYPHQRFSRYGDIESDIVALVKSKPWINSSDRCQI